MELFKPDIEAMSDEDLVVKITQCALQIRQNKYNTLVQHELQSCKQEVVRRGKQHLWYRARDCYQSY